MFRPPYMTYGSHLVDNQQAALSFLTQQLSIIEPGVYKIRYPNVQYPELVPVDSSGNEWAKSITFFSSEQVGKAQWFHSQATDIPIADVSRDKFEQGIEMAAIGYRYNTEELAQAMMVPGLNLTADRASAAKRIYEEFVDDVALRGDTQKGWYGLINQPTITAVNAPADGTGSSPLWSTKTDVQIMRDFNSILTGMYLSTLTLEQADTVLMPLQLLTDLSSRQFGVLNMTVLDWLRDRNLNTFTSRMPLEIRGVRGLETAGDAGSGRIVAYRKDPQVIKLHIPMPHKFLPPWPRSALVTDIPGIFRLGGVEIRRPSAFRYMDHVM